MINFIDRKQFLHLACFIFDEGYKAIGGLLRLEPLTRRSSSSVESHLMMILLKVLAYDQRRLVEPWGNIGDEPTIFPSPIVLQELLERRSLKGPKGSFTNTAMSILEGR